MPKIWGDEEGLVWDEPVIVGRSASTRAKGESGEKAVKAAPSPKAFRTAPAPADYKLPTLFPRIREASGIIIDIETYDPNLETRGPGEMRQDGFITGVGVATLDWVGEYYPVRHAGINLSEEKVFGWLADELADYRGEILGGNLIYDGPWLATKGVRWPKARISDPQLAGPLLDENRRRYNLNALADWLLPEGSGKSTEDIIRLYGEGFIQNMHLVHAGHARTYVLGDLRLPKDLLAVMGPMLEAEGLTQLYDIERGLYHMLAYMRERGVRFDVNAAPRLGEKLKAMKGSALERIYAATGIQCEVNAARSVAKVFDKLGLSYPMTKGTEKRAPEPSFKKEWLAAHTSPVAQDISLARRAGKFNGDFVEGWLRDCVGDRLHCQFNQLKNDKHGTVSGRFSSSNPNLQQVPQRDEELGPLIRALFIPDHGKLWWSMDYSQIEYRLLLHYGVVIGAVGAKEAAQLYWDNPDMDFHNLASLIVFGKEDKQTRKTAKNINFGIVYGMGKDHMCEVLGFDLDDEGRSKANAILENYHSKLPFARETYNLAMNKALTTGYIRTILGRRRRFNLWEPKRFDFSKGRPEGKPRAEAEALYGMNLKRAYAHAALNSLLQGSAADMNKKAMLDIWEAGLIGPGNPLDCSLTVHDELDGDFEDGPIQREALREARQLMIDAVPLRVPVGVALDTGLNWAEAH